MPPSRGLVSTVIPTYNRAYCLGQAVDSVMAQTHRDVEVLVVDDGSTDRTETLIRERYGLDSRVRYIRQDNRGVSAARNRGLSEARGDFIALLDSDDLWKPWKLELQLACLRRFPEAGMVWSDMEAIDARGQRVAPRYLRKMYSAWAHFELPELFRESCSVSSLGVPVPGNDEPAFVHAGDVGSPMIMGNLVHTSTVLLTRGRQEMVGGFNEALRYSGEDYEFHLRTCRAGAVAFADLATIQYRVGAADQLTQPQYAVHVARNFLDTVLPVLQNHRDSVHLPDRMVRQVLAEAYAWLGECQLESGTQRAAAASFLTSLRHRPWQPRVTVLAMSAVLPSPARRILRHAWRSLKLAARRAR